jgi:N4-gp56 family major capsid protein
MADTTVYGDISPRSAAYASKQFLKRGMPFLVLEKFGQTYPIPSKSTKVGKWRRYNALDASPKTLTEGVTPSASKLTASDVTATLDQYGDRLEISDVIMDTHEDPVLQQSIDILGEQAAEMVEEMRYGVIKAGTSVDYANGSSRSDVNTTLTLGQQRRILRGLKSQRARKITNVIKSTPDYATQPVAASYIALCHTDCEAAIRDMAGFVPVEKYGQIPPWESEIGKVEDVRYVASQVFQPFADAGGTAGDMISTSGSQADVYPILYIGRDAYGIVPLKGKLAVTPMVVNPKPSDSDPLAQRGHVGWKSMQTAVILNDAWLVRGEVAVEAS